MNERLGDSWKQYSFDYILQTVYDVFSLKKIKKRKLSAAAGLLLSIIDAEYAKQRRIERYNSKQKSDRGQEK